MTKLQKTLQAYYEKDNGNGSIAGLIGYLEGANTISKEEADYLMVLLSRHTDQLLGGI